MCAVMTAATPLSMAALNGTSSTASMRARVMSSTGSVRCESDETSPCPGKCLAVASIPASCVPRTYAVASEETFFGSSPNERMLMMGLAGLFWTSTTG